MKFPVVLCLLFFASLSINSQDFDALYKKATEAYDNEVINSPYLDKALEACPDIKKYPHLLRYKARDLLDSEQYILAIKYFELAKLYTKKDSYNLSITNNLALLYAELGQHEKANAYLQENLKKATKVGNEFFKTESTFALLIEAHLTSEVKPSLDKFWNFYNGLDEKSNDRKFLFINSYFDAINEQGLFKESKKIKKYIYKNFTLDAMNLGDLSYLHSNNAFLAIGLKDFQTALKHNDTNYFISKKALGLTDVLIGLEIYKEIYEQNNQLDIALQYVDSIKILEKKLKKTTIKSSLNTVDENILFNKTKNKTAKTIKDYKTTVIIIVSVSFLLMLLYFNRNKKQKNSFKTIASKLTSNNLKYNASLRDNLAFKKGVKELLKAKKFDELSTFHKKHELDDLSNDTYITYLAADIEPAFLTQLEKTALEFSDIEKTVLYYRKNKYTYQQIAIITNRTLRSIEGLSYRLNKKIYAETNQELAIFLETL